VPAKFPSLVFEPLRVWLRRRAERKALLMATDGLGHSPEAFLTDIGVSRDDITALCVVAKARREY
jgi:uncharacterized protein YjiS (DUF1127 family)